MATVSSDFHDSSWRPVFAALANPDVRTVYAWVVLGRSEIELALSPSRRQRATASLVKAGLIEERDGGYVASDVFSDVLRNAPRSSTRRGVARFLTADGRVDRYPSSAGDRRELLAHILDQCLEPGEVLTENEVNERLVRYDPDVATLRRYLIDAELLTRRANGSQYARSDH